MSKHLVITGACGFVGHHLLEGVLKSTDWRVTCLDRLSYASMGYDRLRDIRVWDEAERVRRVETFSCDITLPLTDGVRREVGSVDYIWHVAAETHVDNSIRDPWPFVQSNLVGTYQMLQWARTLDSLDRFVMFSTDEVYGPAPAGYVYREWDRYNATNPYAATKAGAEQLALAWANTYGLPVVITNTMNVYGERQHAEKFIPSTVRKVLAGERVIIHADPTRTESGTRFYIHGRNVADALLFLMPRAVQRERYNIVGECEVSNLEMARRIADILDKPLFYEMVDFHSSRPGHDLRYGLCGDKMAAMGWTPPVSFDESLERTIRWIAAPENRKWLEWKP